MSHPGADSADVGAGTSRVEAGLAPAPGCETPSTSLWSAGGVLCDRCHHLLITANLAWQRILAWQLVEEKYFCKLEGKLVV